MNIRYPIYEGVYRILTKQKDIFGDTTWFTYRYEVNGMVYETSAGSLDICRKARDKWMKMMSVAFTGHRTIRTNKYALSVSLNEEVRFCYENGIRFSILVVRLDLT